MPRLVPWFAACAVACAHAPSVPAPGPAAHGAEVRRVYDDASLGYELELPNDRRFRPGGGDAVAAVGDDGTVVRVFPLFVAGPVDAAACWSRLADRGLLPAGLTAAPADGPDLSRRGPEGLDRDHGRRAYLQVYPRKEDCLVLAVEAPAATEAERAALASAARMAAGSFHPREPAPALRPLLAFEAGFQLIDGDEPVAALAKFEEALRLDPQLDKAHLGAGLAAFFAGKGYEKTAVAHLEKAVARRADSDTPEGNAFEDRQYREALMDLGLSYAALKDYASARQKLLEASSRFPDDAVVAYNFACVLAQSGEADEALYQLGGALGRDPSLAAHARDDEDLASLHDRPQFQRLMAQAPPGAPASPAPPGN